MEFEGTATGLVATGILAVDFAKPTMVGCPTGAVFFAGLWLLPERRPRRFAGAGAGAAASGALFTIGGSATGAGTTGEAALAAVGGGAAAFFFGRPLPRFWGAAGGASPAGGGGPPCSSSLMMHYANNVYRNMMSKVRYKPKIAMKGEKRARTRI